MLFLSSLFQKLWGLLPPGVQAPLARVWSVISILMAGLWGLVPGPIRSPVSRFVRSEPRRLSFRLHLALGMGMVLTMLAVMVGFSGFEDSDERGLRVREGSMSAMDAAWSVQVAVGDLQSLGLGVLAGEEMGSAQGSLDRIEAVLGVPQDPPDLQAESIMSSARQLAKSVELMGQHLQDERVIESALDGLRSQVLTSGRPGPNGSLVLFQVLRAPDQAALDGFLDEVLNLPGSAEWDELSIGDEGAFVLRGKEFNLALRREELESDIRERSLVLDRRVDELVQAARESFLADAESLSGGFGHSRSFLVILGVGSLFLAFGAGVLLVDRRLFRRLRLLSGSVRDMADGEPGVPIPPMGDDELGELALGLEAVRQRLSR